MKNNVEPHDRACEKTNPKRTPRVWSKFLFPFIGIASLLWFLIRVIPKPSRAAYRA